MCVCLCVSVCVCVCVCVCVSVYNFFGKAWNSVVAVSGRVGLFFSEFCSSINVASSIDGLRN